MSKIIGVTVGTPTSPAAMEEKMKPVKSVNGKFPDESGNVELDIPEGSGGASVSVDGKTLILENGIMRVNTTNEVEEDNTQPITSAAVHTTVGNVELLLSRI